MSKLGQNPIYLPFNLEFEIEKYLNGYLIWSSSFLQSSKYFSPVSRLDLNFQNNKRVLNIYFNQHCLKYYFLQKSILEKKLTQKISLLHMTIKQNLISVLVGYKKILSVGGVGYRFSLTRNVLFLEAGYSHLLSFRWKNILKTKFSRKLKGILVKSQDLNVLMPFLSQIKISRPMNVYTRKGIRYRKENLKYKKGKRKRSF